MTHYPCEVCGYERCTKCCSECGTENGCECAAMAEKKFKGVPSWMLELELARREQARQDSQKKRLLDEIAKLQKELDALES